MCLKCHWMYWLGENTYRKIFELNIHKQVCNRMLGLFYNYLEDRVKFTD